ncbi:thioredoxin domain-containing protein [Nostocoides sp. HKS02]|uniref:thioredoxin domain-containing protein n=1 Tax=Nostocoides sp. HKS02 TaxID=1813880 RepID=UPI00351B06CC
MNRLAHSTSPYLLQHKDNPVDWQEWGPEAFEEARRRDVPVLLSVGYAACHWCHVMAHESFEDDEVAAALNEGFVAVKVDREERPDVDSVYMSATTALTGHGGWPMTCVLTPDAEPFFCGTYFPKAQFLHVLAQVREVWTTQRERVTESSAHISDRLRELTASTSAQPIDDAALAQAVQGLRSQFDLARGGFGGAPKFPPSMVLEFLLRHHARTGSADALAMARRTCEAMARGGIYDQLAGGFARYSVDAAWVVPHFEKMLYDNAQLLRVYAHLFRTTGDDLARRVTAETAAFLVRDLGTGEGGFASALDADTDGVEGLTYAWTPDQLAEVLGEHDGRTAAELLGVTEQGTFEHGSSTLQLATDPDDPEWWQRARHLLWQSRNRRPQPARDDKVVTSWNGLAIAALSDAAVLLDDAALLAAAQQCAEFVVDTHLVEGRLRRSSRGGRVGAAHGVADDYGNLAEGLLALVPGQW